VVSKLRVTNTPRFIRRKWKVYQEKISPKAASARALDLLSGWYITSHFLSFLTKFP
jgi:hypothetical protein